MKKLDLLTFPLDGLNLIEASAGTGKTYALANLYLRCLLEKQWTVDQILVVTFTEAATQELRNRIRLRIQELRSVLEGSDSSDPILLALASQAEDTEAALLNLRIAERQMDESEIFTIHGFCQRLLQSHALSLGAPLAQTLNEDLRPLWQQQTDDFWRTDVLSLPTQALFYLREFCSDPEALLEKIWPLVQRRAAIILPEIDAGGMPAWAERFEAWQIWLETLRTETRAHIDSVEDLIASAAVSRPKDKQRWLGQIKVWCELDASDLGQMPRDSNKNCLFGRFTTPEIPALIKKGGDIPAHPWFDFLEAHLPQQPHSLPETFLHTAYKALLKKTDQLKRDQSMMGFDDLIGEVAVALDAASGRLSEQQRAELVGTIRSRYALALIDEFQDTDPAQYQIFHSLFASSDQECGPKLTLIGDPKQAIYAFRGGDIATYLRAKKDVSTHAMGQVFTMDTNWRSSMQMVAAVNRVFARTTEPFMSPDIPFVEVAAGLKDDENKSGSVRAAREPRPALQLCFAPVASRNKDDVEQDLAHFCAREIAGMLGLLTTAGTSGGELQEQPAQKEQWQSQDIAVLVRTSREAEMLKDVMTHYGIRASFEARSSIYNTDEAMGLLCLLQAVAEPSNLFYLKQCLAQPLFAYSDAELAQVLHHTERMTVMMGIFRALQTLWESKGALGMIRMALLELGVLKRWRARANNGGGYQTAWERRLSNINQLSELLQQQARINQGSRALIRWLRERILRSESVNDDNRIRLESDDKLVQIVTIHKSKGLEYPVVFLPFMHSAKAATEAGFYNADGERVLDLGAQPEHLLKAEQERLQEDMRLLYVALTRAKYHCVIGFSDYTGKRPKVLGLKDTAWGRLLLNGSDEKTGGRVDQGIDKNPDEDDIRRAMAGLCATSGSLVGIREVPQRDESIAFASGQRSQSDRHNESQSASTSTSQSQSRSGKLPAQARKLERSLSQRWKVHSFTGLLQEHQALTPGPLHHSAASASESRRSGTDEPLLFGLRKADVSMRSAGLHIFDFPRGSRPGVFLHALFEAIEFESGELQEHLRSAYRDLPDYIETQLSAYALVDPARLQVWTERLQHWLQAALAAVLAGGNESRHALRLRDIRQGHYIAEMEFYFAIAKANADQLNKVLALNDANAAPLVFSEFEGHLKGAIDLVFEHEGQFYVLDYKSNYLGDQPSDYQQEYLLEAMRAHRYDLQYLLYVLAVHRHLRQRMGADYCYERDFGGVLYVFLRGLALDDSSTESISTENASVEAVPTTGQTGVFFHKPELAVIQALESVISASGDPVVGDSRAEDQPANTVAASQPAGGAPE